MYREGRQTVSGTELARQLRACLAGLAAAPTQDGFVAALLQAGELECALYDAALSGAATATVITDRIAGLVCSQSGGEDSRADQFSGIVTEMMGNLGSICPPRDLTLSCPEGFAYYALHPLDFADAIAQRSARPASALVIGIRTIGTTLSAVIAAQLARMGAVVERTTVRPGGHPYQRHCNFDAGQLQSIKRALQTGADFLVCDEGPGRSGSSFLSVAEALEREGVPSNRITLLCSHQPDVDSLCAPNAPQRWGRYQSLASGMTRRLPSQAGKYLGGGEWRRLLVSPGERWPAAWPQTERLKY